MAAVSPPCRKLSAGSMAKVMGAETADASSLARRSGDLAHALGSQATASGDEP